MTANIDLAAVTRGFIAADRWQRDEPRISGDANDALEALASLATIGNAAELVYRASQPAPPRPEEEATRPDLGAITDDHETTHLLPVLYSALEDLSEESALEWAMLYPYTANWDRAGAAPDMLPPGDEPTEALADLFARLNYAAPQFCYFGHQGSGPFGFWLDRDAIEEAVSDGDVVMVPQRGPGQPTYLLVGTGDDVALYALTKKEIFAYVAVR